MKFSQHVDTDAIVRDFDLKPFGAKGWLASKNIPCPYCGRGDKFGFKVSKDGGVVHCFICDISKPLGAYLRDVGQLSYVSEGKTYSLNLKLSESLKKPTKGHEEIKEIAMPSNHKYLKKSLYLNRRNFNQHHYKIFKPFLVDDILGEHKGYIFFSLFMDGKLAGWLARSKMSYQWHKENLEQFKLGNGELRLRYENSIGTDFSKILGGYDEIGEETDTVIAVEGLFDKVNVDTQLELNENPNIKCVFTFGNKFSDGQIQLLRKKKSIKSVILMYDPEATLQNKKYSKSLEKYFDAYVARLTKPNIDPGDASREYLMHTLKNEVYSPIQFHFTSLPTSNLETRRRLKQ